MYLAQFGSPGPMLRQIGLNVKPLKATVAVCVCGVGGPQNGCLGKKSNFWFLSETGSSVLMPFKALQGRGKCPF